MSDQKDSCPSCAASGLVGGAWGEPVCAVSGVSSILADEALAVSSLPPSERDPMVGGHVGEDLVIGRIGDCGFGRAPLALQRPLFRLEDAFELIELHTATERVLQKILEKLESGAGALAVLGSPNIVRLLQYGTFHDPSYMAIEYIHGSRTLQCESNLLLVSEGTLDHGTPRHVLDQLLSGLEAAHEHDIIHRGIKPENVMPQKVVRDRLFAELVDFGLAKVITDSRVTSMVLGAVHYIAPERVEARFLGPRTDLHAARVRSCGAGSPTSAPTPDPPEPPDPHAAEAHEEEGRLGGTPCPWVTLGVAGGVGTWAIVDGTSDLQELIDAQATPWAMTEEDAGALVEDSERKRLIGLATVGVGAALWVTSAIHSVSGSGGDEPELSSPTLTPLFNDHAAGLAIGGEL